MMTYAPVEALQNPSDFAKILFQALLSGNWVVVLAAALVLVVAIIRIYGQKIQAALPDDNFLDKGLTFLFSSTWGGWLLNLLTAIAGAFATALLAGAPITFSIVQGGIITALSGAALWELIKDLFGLVASKKLPATSAEAVKAINEKTE